MRPRVVKVAFEVHVMVGKDLVEGSLKANRLRLISNSIEDMILLELELETAKKKIPPFTLLLHSNTLGPEWKTDVSLCVQLARVSDEWSVSVCGVDNVRHLHKFEVSSRETFQKDDLIRLAKQIKEQQMAVRAAALADGPRQSKKRNPRGPRRRVPKNASRLPDSDVSSGEGELHEWQLFDAGSDKSEGSDSEGFFEEHDGPALAGLKENAVSAGPGSSPRPAEAEAAVPPAEPPPKPVRVFVGKQRRGVPWGPFQIAPIYSQGSHIGWGAICGLHKDPFESTNQCRKAITLKPEQGIDDEICVLRLKRWLLAGTDDTGWPQHCLRTHHVYLGGTNLITFAEGKSEIEMDQEIQQAQRRT